MEFNETPKANSNLFEDFIDIDEFITAIDDGKKDTSFPDFLDQFELTKDDMLVSDEVCEATKLLTEEQEEFADFIISSLDFDDRNENVPFKSQLNQNDWLSGHTHNFADSTVSLEMSPSITHESAGITSENPKVQKIGYLEDESAASSPDIDDKTIEFLLTSGLAEVSEIIKKCDVVSSKTATNNFTEPVAEFSDSSTVSELVLNEFVELLNSLDENSFNLVVAEMEGNDIALAPSNNVAPSNNDCIQNVNTNFQISFDLSMTSSNENDNGGLLPIQNISATVNNSYAAENTTKNVTDLESLKRKHYSVSFDESSILSSASSVTSDTVVVVEEKTLFRRFKNNEASKVTRAKRRCREKDLFEKEQELIKSNADLRVKTELMQKEADLLRSLLINALNGAKTKQ